MGWRLVGRGSDLGLEVEGDSLAACLGSAVEGFAAAVTGAELPPVVGADASLREEEVAHDEASPADLLVALVDDLILRVDAHGELGVGLTVSSVEGGRLRGRLSLVELGAVELRGVTPKAATWHGVRLEDAGEGWTGAIMLDL